MVQTPHGGEYVFDGTRWTGNDEEEVSLLNDALERIPRHHYGVEAVARNCLEQSGLKRWAKVVSVHQDVWSNDEELVNGVD